jgi:hypothetical protein
MSYSVDNIIQVSTTILPQGIGFANFGSGLMFAPESELPVGFLVDTTRTYSSLSALSVDFASTTETYKAMERWLGGIPATNEVTVWAKADLDATITDTLNKARNVTWWFYSFFTVDIYADLAKVAEIAAWSNTNESYFMNCQTGASATAIRDPGDSADIASTLTTTGERYVSTLAHATDPYAGIALCKWFGSVNYNGTNTSITGEYKKLSGVAAESLTDTEYGSMRLDTKKSMFYTQVDLQGEFDAGRVINSWSHSSFGEYMDDVVDLAAFINNVKANIYNTLANSNKVGQDVKGQASLIGAAKAVGEQYIQNGYLGERIYTNPDNGQEAYTKGYEILSKAEDILTISDSERADRDSAPIKIRIFRRRAVHTVPVDITVY